MTGRGSGVEISDEGESSRVEGKGRDAGKWSGGGDSAHGDRSSFEGFRDIDADSGLGLG